MSLAFLPMLLFYGISVKYRDQLPKDEFYVGTAVFLVYLLLYLINLFKLVKNRSKQEELEEEDKLNVLELRSGCDTSRNLGLLFNALAVPASQVFVCLFSLFYTLDADRTPGVVNYLLPCLVYLLLLAVSVFARPFKRKMHNIYLWVSISVLLLVTFLSVGSATNEAISKMSEFIVLVLIILFLVSTCAIVLIVPTQADENGYGGVVMTESGSNVIMPSVNARNPQQMKSGRPTIVTGNQIRPVRPGNSPNPTITNVNP